MKKMRNDSSKLERHHIANEVKPIESFVYKDVKVAIGDGGFDQIIVPLTDLQTELKEQFPGGFYEAIFTVFHAEKPLLEQPIWFDKNHDIEKGLTEKGREKARFTTAKIEAKKLIDDLVKHQVFEEMAA